jgi:acyl-CoA thioesterase I
MKKNKLLVIALFCFSVIALMGCARKEIRNLDSQGVNIICFGNSLTFGYGANPGEDYPSILAKLINAPVINAGIDGDDTSIALKRIESDCLDREPLLVIIELCGNDFLRKLPMETTINNTKEMIERIQARGAMAAIADTSVGMFLAEYRRAFSRLAREKGVIFIPRIMNGIITNPSMKSDFLHPNANGYKLIAQRIRSSIAPYLQQNAKLRMTTK